MEPDLGLVVPDRVEALRAAGRDYGVALNDGAEHSIFKLAVLPLPHHLCSQGEGAHVRENYLPDGLPALLDRPLDGGSQSHSLVRVDVRGGKLFKQPARKAAVHRAFGCPAHQHHLIDVA